MEEAWNGMTSVMPRLLDFGTNLLVALLILIVGWWVSSLLGRWVRRALLRSNRIDPTIVPMFQSVAVWTVRIFTLIAVLARFGVQTASIIAVLGAAGLAIGLALQGTLQNISAGIMLIILRPLRAGEYVALSTGFEGTVDEVGLFLTRLIKFDGVVQTVPNSTVWTATITNYSRNAQRRLDIPVTIHYDDDLDGAIAALQKLVSEHPQVEALPKPEVMAMEYRENGTVVNVRVWFKAGDFWAGRWDLTQRIRKALAAAGFKAPVPVREIQNVSVPAKAEDAA